METLPISDYPIIMTAVCGSPAEPDVHKLTLSHVVQFVRSALPDEVFNDDEIEFHFKRHCFPSETPQQEDFLLADMDDLIEFFTDLEPVIQKSLPELLKHFSDNTLNSLYTLLSVPHQNLSDSVRSGGVEGSGVRKEDLREYLEATTCADGKPLIGSLDFAQLTRDCGRTGGVVSVGDFHCLMAKALCGRRICRANLMTSVEAARQQRREAKRVAIEMLKAANDREGNAVVCGGQSLGSELRTVASPRRRAISPYAFDSWRASQGAVVPVSGSGSSTPSLQGSASVPSPSLPTPPRDIGQPPAYQEAKPRTPPIGKLATEASRVQHPAATKASADQPVLSSQPAAESNVPLKTASPKANADLRFSFTNIPVVQSEDYNAHTAMVDEAFALLDVNEGGSVSLDAIYEFCAAFPRPPQQNAVRRLFHLVDVNASNDIDREEFEQLCFLLQQKTGLTVTEMCSYFTTAMYRRLFELCDDDGDANEAVGREELRVLLEAISPILNASFNSGDIYRLTKEFKGDQLDFEQFQFVLKHLIKGRSISKVVAAFEEALRRRRLLKRQALERFSQAAAPPAGAPAKKKFPPPPPQSQAKPACISCSANIQRVHELESALSSMQKMVETVERQRDALQAQVHHARQVALLQEDFFPDAALTWFQATDKFASSRVFYPFDSNSTSPNDLPGCLADELSVSASRTLPLVTEEMLASVAAVGGDQKLDVVIRVLTGTPERGGMLFGSDRVQWYETEYRSVAQRAATAEAALHSAISMEVLPAVEAAASSCRRLLKSLRDVQRTRQESGAVPQDLLAAAQEHIKASQDSRNGALSTWQTKVPSVLHEFITQREYVGVACALSQSNSKAPRTAATPRGAETPRGKTSPSSSPPLAAQKMHDASGAALVAPFEAATTRAVNFARRLITFTKQLEHVESLGHGVLNACSEQQVNSTDSVEEAEFQRRIGVCEERLSAMLEQISDFTWNQLHFSLCRSLDDVSSALSVTVQSSKRDKSVMANLLPALSDADAKASNTIVIATRARSTSLTRAGGATEASNAPGAAISPGLHPTQEFTVRSSSPRLRSRRERPADVRHHVDRLLSDFVLAWGNKLPGNFSRADPSTNIFYFGTRRIELSAVDQFITVKVGGGYLLLDEFCEKYAAMEIRRLQVSDDRAHSVASPSPGNSAAKLRLDLSPFASSNQQSTTPRVSSRSPRGHAVARESAQRSNQPPLSGRSVSSPRADASQRAASNSTLRRVATPGQAALMLVSH